MQEKTDLKGKDLAELKALMSSVDEKPFRAGQLYQWMYKFGVSDFNLMTNLPVGSRQKFESLFHVSTLKSVREAVSLDGTAKFLWKLADGKDIESVLIPDDRRLTACVSSQVGCALACRFCATGTMGLTRNLTPGEIYDQVFMMNRWAMATRGQQITNIVFMGMGEPMMNLQSVMKGIDLIADPAGVAISRRRITISTAGVAHKIRELADLETKTLLAVSLHAVFPDKRNSIMPINKGTGLEELLESVVYYCRKTGQRVTYEYVMFQDFNDGPEDAKRLADICRLAPSKVNIILYNPIEGAPFARVSQDRLNAFIRILVDRHVTVVVRQSRGQDIDAACGQLAVRNQKEGQLVSH
ncbi:MAG: 23S rRNA (adenine(2503)-C(2))-methyltransferase RlmN [Bacteroidetes bacterium]|nr:23S rRNA (adenine(2503)-C(2))-methyltransferase RlmN [Bacteroidota bacterium]